MTDALLISNVLLWALVLVLVLVVLALTRQVGILHERIAPAGALAVTSGPAVGDAAPRLVLEREGGGRVEIGGPDANGLRTLLFFLSPTCPVCKTLLPTIHRLVESESPGLRIVYSSDGTSEAHAEFRRVHRLEAADYVLSEQLGRSFEVAKLPYAVLIDAQGRVRASGIVNTREHLESLFEADRLGVSSIGDYLHREQLAGANPSEATPALQVVPAGATASGRLPS